MICAGANGGLPSLLYYYQLFKKTSFKAGPISTVKFRADGIEHKSNANTELSTNYRTMK
jgi:hypothetical protein